MGPVATSATSSSVRLDWALSTMIVPAVPAARAVGYRQLWRHLAGQCTLEEAATDAITATRRYAKRQLTWLRSEPDFVPLPEGSAPRRQAALKRLEAVGALDAMSGRSR